MDAVYKLAFSKPYVESVAWADLADMSHMLPGGGLLDDMLKPKPAYTREARDLGLEGEVVLDVLFTASGDVRVLTVMRGLGHGLDEAAVRAAQARRACRARRAGSPASMLAGATGRSMRAGLLAGARAGRAKLATPVH